MGRSRATHSSHTGKREILTRGAPRRRQSEGNNVAKTHSAMPLTEETNEDAICRATTLVPEARNWSPLLLKTNLPRPAAAWGSRRTNLLQYSGPAKYKRSEEHTSELQSRFDLVCRLL